MSEEPILDCNEAYVQIAVGDVVVTVRADNESIDTAATKVKELFDYAENKYLKHRGN